MKNIIIGALIPLVLVAIIYFYTQASLPETIWSDENRHILQESLSPNGKLKVGVYNYDSGAFGYTSVQVSAVGNEEIYPIAGNLLQGHIVDSIKWNSESGAEITILSDTELKSKLVFWFE
jgi:hypothetical protein